MWREQQLLLRSSTESADGSPSGKSKILFHNGELNLLWLVSDSVAARCRRGRGMGGQDGLLADADAQ
jgi:hypothetical protein